MRFRVGLALSVLTLFIGVGCRKPLAPNVDRNVAPETWITQAPQDTITEKDSNGFPVVTPPGGAGTIPVRFHLYWAGSDRDGTVAGFYYAVVETIPVPPPGLFLPALPGPKPHDYHFTTRTDTTFIFDVSEFRADRQHAFFIYAVDDKGKPDPTPARFIFNALDRFPPDPYIFELKALGRIYRELGNGTLVSKDTTVFVHDSLTFDNQAKAPQDTVPSVSGLTIKWRGEPTIAGTYVTGYRYKLDEQNFIEAPAESTSKSYLAGAVAPGLKVFTLKVLDQAGGSQSTNRRFQMNYSPDTWFAGPDPNLFGPPNPVTHERSLTLPDMSSATLRATPQLRGTMLSSDSLVKLPAERPYQPTFYEIYKDKIYIHTEGDTVNLNSWVIFHAGGLDVDSPYNVAVKTNEPALSDTQFVTGPARVVRPGPPNGSPIGFQYLFSFLVTPFSSLVAPPLSGLAPVFDAARVDRNPVMGAYINTQQAAQVFITLKSVDGDGALDKRILDPRKTVLFGTDPALRTHVITFFVDKPPRLNFNQPGFVPRPDTTFFSRDNIKFNLFASDDDPFDLDPRNRPNPGGPSVTTVLRWTVTLRGTNLDGRDTTFAPPGAFRSSSPAITVSVPSYFAGQDVYAEIELCDCADCELAQGSGRCINFAGANAIHFRVPPPSAPAGATSQIQGPRPGPGSITGRSSR